MTTLPPQSRLGRFPYYIQKRLNEEAGAMSEVYLATLGRPTPQQSTAPTFVLKIARTFDTHGTFHHVALENEVERLRRLKHPGIVRLYPILHDDLPNLPYMAQSDLDGSPWFSVMEYLPGGSLADMIAQDGPLALGLALEIGRSLAATLDYLHNRGQVHLDIKPENVMFRTTPYLTGIEPVLIDLGIARDIGQAGLVANTLAYAAPERLQVSQGGTTTAQPQPAMDIYSLGLVLYQMLTGKLPFQGRDRQSLTTAILEGNPTSPATYQTAVSTELETLILASIHKDPDQRPTAEALAMSLEQLIIKYNYKSGTFPVAKLSTPDLALEKEKPRHFMNWAKQPVVLGGVSLIVLVVMIWIALVGQEVSQAKISEPPALATAGAQQPLDLSPSTTPTPQPISPVLTATLPKPSPTPTEPVEPSTTLPLTVVPTRTPLATLAPTPTRLKTEVESVEVNLISPLAGEASGAWVTFQWQADQQPQANRAFELVFWKPG